MEHIDLIIAVYDIELHAATYSFARPGYLRAFFSSILSPSHTPLASLICRPFLSR